MTKITNRRRADSRKKWVTISARFINGKTEELAKFRHIGDAMLYLYKLTDAPYSTSTIEEIFTD